jgi:asparagine synthase (glutamine-hydrolysing)
MFAFALWDARQNELILARDRLGEKPLYYYEDHAEGSFFFASEVRTLLASGRVERKLDPTTLSVYLFNGFTIAPRTIIQNVRSVLPGHWMRVSQDGTIRETRRYWRIPTYHGDETPAGDDDLRDTLDESVRMRLISDVPLGAFLSGGMDSSLIVALMSSSSEKVRTFSIGFHEKEFDETPFARWVAERFRTTHTEILLGPDEFTSWLDDGLMGMDQPTFDGLNTYFVSRAARESGLTVALSGLGGDELFGGYPFFNSSPLLARLARLTRWIPPGYSVRLASELGGYHGIRKGFHLFGERIPAGMELLAAYQTSLALIPSLEQSTLLAETMKETDPWFGLPAEFIDFLNDEGEDADHLSLLSKYILRLFEGERTLRDGDCMSMAVSLEVRTAFTDHVLIEKLWNTPGRVRCAGSPDKSYEVELAQAILGSDFPFRKKQGFTFPFQEWIKGGRTRQIVENTLQDAKLARTIGFHPEGVSKLTQPISNLPWSRVWAVFVLMYWANSNNVAL